MSIDSFAKRLRKAMELKGWTQSKLCEVTKLDKSLISNYLSGKYKPKQDKIVILSKALDVSEPWLMGFDISMNIKSDNIEKITPTEFSQEVKTLLLRTGKLSDSEKAHIISTLDLICRKDDNNE